MSFSQAVEDGPGPVGALDGLPEAGVPRHANGLCTMSGMFSPGGVRLAMTNAPVHRLATRRTLEYTEPLRSLGVIRVTRVEAERLGDPHRRVRVAQSAEVDVGLRRLVVVGVGVDEYHHVVDVAASCADKDRISLIGR